MYKFVELWTCRDWNRILTIFESWSSVPRNAFKHCNSNFGKVQDLHPLLSSEYFAQNLGINGHFRPIGLTSYCIIFPLDPTGERQQRASLAPSSLGIFPVFPSFAISFVFCLILQIFCVASQAVRRRIISEMHSSYELCGGSLSSEAAPGSSESLLVPSSK